MTFTFYNHNFAADSILMTLCTEVGNNVNGVNSDAFQLLIMIACVLMYIEQFFYTTHSAIKLYV